jgi:hypothetical protein
VEVDKRRECFWTLGRVIAIDLPARIAPATSQHSLAALLTLLLPFP